MNAEPLPTLPPLDPNAVDDADADRERRIVYLRKALAEAKRPSRAAMLRLELYNAEKRTDG